MRRAVVLVLAALAGCSALRASPAAPTSTVVLKANATMVRVVDGDTIDVSVDGTDERVRLIGIDTPETKKQDTPVQCFGPEATKFTASLLAPGDQLYLERDVVARDDFGRLLAYVYRVSDGLFVNLRIVSGGYARPLTIPPNVAHADEFADAASDARERRSGLWSACGG